MQAKKQIWNKLKIYTEANGKFVYFNSVRLISLTCKALQNPASFDES